MSELPTFDERDKEILQERSAQFLLLTSPTVGDWIDFADGKSLRLALRCRDYPNIIQPSIAGSVYLGCGGWTEFSGTLGESIDINTLTPTNERREGQFWFFHHGHVKAYNRVDCMAPCRVWKCSVNAPTY